MTTHRLPRRTSAAALTRALLAGDPALAQGDADCAGFDRTIVFGKLGYDSADVLTDLARFVLEEGFGCATDANPGATLPVLQGMIRGDVDMELWVDNAPEFWHDALAAGEVRELSHVFDDTCFAHMNAMAEADTPELATGACDYPVVVAAVGLGSAFADTIPAPIESFLDAFYP